MATRSARLLLTFLSGSTIFLAAPEAKALQDTQSTSTVNFATSASGTGATTSSSPLSLSFPGFNTSSIPAGRTNIKLTGYQFEIVSATYSGSVNLTTALPDTANNTYNFTLAGQTFFQGLQQLGNGSTYVNTSSTNGILTPSSVTSTAGPCSGTFGCGFFANSVISGTVANVTSTFQSVPLSGSGSDLTQVAPYPNPVASSSYYTTWTIVASPNTGGTTTFNPAVINGLVKVNYQYTYDSAETPAPLPLLGAGAAFGWSRRLRKRISATV